MYQHKNGIKFSKLPKTLLPKLLELKEESWFGTHNIAIVNLDDQERWYNSISQSKNDIILVAIYNSESIGLFKINNIDWISRGAHIGHDIFSEFRGKGLGYKIVEAGVDFCFEILNMHRLDAEVLANNLASQKTLFNGGFVQEGIRRAAVHKCNEYLDSIVCGVLRTDWLTLERVKNYDFVCNTSYQPLNQVK